MAIQSVYSHRNNYPFLMISLIEFINWTFTILWEMKSNITTISIPPTKMTIPLTMKIVPATNLVTPSTMITVQM